MSKNEKLWGGRFSGSTDARVEALNASIDVDRILFREDIAGSIAHATMLGEQGIISSEDVEAIVGGLRDIHRDIEEENFVFRVDLEDIHMNVEAALRERVGDAAGRLHTARSRNDQVALDVRMWLRRRVLDVMAGLSELRASLLHVASQHYETVLPGYTHLQRAQPVTLAHTLLAYEAMFSRDFSRFENAWHRVDVMPLGSGALAGTPFPIDRQRVAELLGFSQITTNSQDGVACRDHMIEVTSACAIAMSHLSRLSEELVLWSSAEFGFVQLPDAFCTGSSIMPQKKNPDIPELVRGKAARSTGDLVALLGLVKALPLAYNKDLQEDKAPLFHAIDDLDDVLGVMAPLIRGMKPQSKRMEAALKAGHLTATDLADALVGTGMPFRDAHRVVGELVRAADHRGCSIAELPQKVLAESLPDEIGPLDEILSPLSSVSKRDLPGGPAPRRTREAVAVARKVLARNRRRIRALTPFASSPYDLLRST